MKNKLKIVGVTGHRKLFHSKYKIKQFLNKKFTELNVDVVITGVALGFDMLVADICIENQIPFIAAIPFIGQNNRWPEREKLHWEEIVKKAYKRTIISPGSYAVWKLFERNRWIVERSSYMISYWSGEQKGGTYQCVQYANKTNKFVENIFNKI